MFDYAIMLGILVFLLFVLLHKAIYIPNGNVDFFDLHNSKAMRGFWCLIVILIHVPSYYQNSIQDMIGSFAYIGVTFFFMTSAFGLSVNAHKKPASIKNFWFIRVPKLLIPIWVTNIIFVLIFSILFKYTYGVQSIFSINGWVKWLFVCYVAFWIGHYFRRDEKYRKYIVCILVLVFSLSIYYLQHTGHIHSVTWCTESIGFIWGTLLFSKLNKIKEFFINRWFPKVIVFCLLSLILGVLYLRFKSIVFWGDYVLKIALGLSILCFILVLNGKIKIGNKLSCFLGDISFEIYLTHAPVFKTIAKICPEVSSGVFILTSIIVTVLFATVIHKVCNLLLNKCMSQNTR